MNLLPTSKIFPCKFCAGDNCPKQYISLLYAIFKDTDTEIPMKNEDDFKNEDNLKSKKQNCLNRVTFFRSKSSSITCEAN